MLLIDEQRCLSCAGCIGVCPEMALFHDLVRLEVKHDACSLCGICVLFCPVLALTISGE